MIEFIKSNWYWLFPAAVGCIGVIIKATPTKKDDKWWQAIKTGYAKIKEIKRQVK